MFTGFIIVAPADDVTYPTASRRPDEQETREHRQRGCEESSSQDEITKREDNRDERHS